MAPHKVIIDTDPGVDDTFALLLALSASAEELEILQISITFGNVEVESCLKNMVSIFHVLELERQWREKTGREIGYETMAKFKPILSVGAEGPLEDVKNEYDYFHGIDGLAGVHTTAPHFTPKEMWSHLFADQTSTTNGSSPTEAVLPPNFIPSPNPGHKEMLRLLRENEPDTITIIALGPLTNLALAADEDAETFLKVKEVVVMSGSIDAGGNVTPVAEFNTWADAFAAARIYSLTSPNPASTLPPSRTMLPYPTPLSRTLNLTTFPLDITLQHLLDPTSFTAITTPLITAGSPLASWVSIFFEETIKHMKEIYAADAELRFQLHDPSCVWYVLMKHVGEWRFLEGRDVRVEAVGQWTRGMTVVERRRAKVVADVESPVLSHDRGAWLHAAAGNRVRQAVECPSKETMAEELLKRVFGC